MSSNSSVDINDIDFVITTYSQMLYNLAFCHVKTKYNADDIFQEVFLRYIKNTSKFNDEEHRKAWLIRVTINCCKNFNTSSWFKKTVPIDDQLTDEMNESENSELKIDFHNAVLQLPQKYRAVIHLFYYEDMSVEQISNVLDLKPSTVRTQLTRARASLKEILKGGYFDER